jgi:hypothetical protein
MGSGSSQVSPVTAIIVAVVAVIVVVAGGFWYMNRPRTDEIAAAVNRQRGGAPGPVPANAPYGGVPPKAGTSDYSQSTMPAAQPARH